MRKEEIVEVVEQMDFDSANGGIPAWLHRLDPVVLPISDHIRGSCRF